MTSFGIVKLTFKLPFILGCFKFRFDISSKTFLTPISRIDKTVYLCIIINDILKIQTYKTNFIFCLIWVRVNCFSSGFI